MRGGGGSRGPVCAARGFAVDAGGADRRHRYRCGQHRRRSFRARLAPRDEWEPRLGWSQGFNGAGAVAGLLLAGAWTHDPALGIQIVAALLLAAAFLGGLSPASLARRKRPQGRITSTGGRWRPSGAASISAAIPSAGLGGPIAAWLLFANTRARSSVPAPSSLRPGKQISARPAGQLTRASQRC